MTSSNSSDSSEKTPSRAAHGADGLPVVTPDFVEQEDGAELDDMVPTRGYSMIPVAGLGASAGGIKALLDFFRAMPDDSGLVFVVILHLSPTHESTLPELLARSTNMRVNAATDGQKVEANQIYVIPPGRYLTCADEHLRLVYIDGQRGKRNTVDMFFRSLADSHGPHAIAVVLSGADGDGALGIKRVKERGGLTIVQEPTDAEYASMPQAALDTGMVDWVLKVEEMPNRILEYLDNERRLRLASADPLRAPAVPRPTPDAETVLRDVLVFLRTRTGRDFACYKPATIFRRVARRMQVNGVDGLPAYVTYLRTHPGECGALLQDLLISVTNFFRDRDAFEAVERIIPELFKGKTSDDFVRVWVPACATGEEAYSLAMMLIEHAQTLESPPTLQVFACDLNDDAIQAARTGHYPDAITTDVSEERLKRFFVKEQPGYRVRRELREMVLFATHDLLKDAPFSRMDLISCRNLLIYLDRDAQRRLLETLHFALKPGGRLFLGSSEAVDESSPHFRALDKKHRIYTHQPQSRAMPPVPALGPSTLLRTIQAHERALNSAPVVHGKAFAQETISGFRSNIGRELDRVDLAELHFKLVERYAPPSVLVNAEHEVVHLSEHAGEFLKFSGGEPTMNLLRVVDPALRVGLRAALFRAAESSSPVSTPAEPVTVGEDRWQVSVRVSPVPEVGAGFLLVIFEKQEDAAGQSTSRSAAVATSDSVTRYMERELEQVKEHLRNTVEQYETSTEELKASNEELQAMNEELRSATEELETSREELQSINEELTTVNQEMKGKVDELANANSDLQNLMASTSIATVFLDRKLTIMRYTPRAVDMFNLIPGDIGRPLAHLKHRLEYPELLANAAQVLETLVPIEREVTDGAHWFLARLQPYRTLEDHIGGVVLTLVDVTERNRAIEALRLSEERLRLLIEGAEDFAIFTTDPERRVDGWNTGAETVFGYTGADILGHTSDVLFTPDDQAKGEPEREVRIATLEGRAENERWHARKDGTLFYGSGSMMPLRDKSGTLKGFVKIMRDLTENKRTDEALRRQMDELTRFNSAAVGREGRMVELKKEINELSATLGEQPRYVIAGEDDEKG